MITINITEKAKNKEQLIFILQETICAINNGCVIGYYPHFEILGEEEPESDFHQIIQGQFDTLDT